MSGFHHSWNEKLEADRLILIELFYYLLLLDFYQIVILFITILIKTKKSRNSLYFKVIGDNYSNIIVIIVIIGLHSMVN